MNDAQLGFAAAVRTAAATVLRMAADDLQRLAERISDTGGQQ